MSAQSPAKKTGLIERETQFHTWGYQKMNIEHRTLNVQHRIMNSVNLKKDGAIGGASAYATRAKLPFEIRLG